MPTVPRYPEPGQKRPSGDDGPKSDPFVDFPEKRPKDGKPPGNPGSATPPPKPKPKGKDT